MYYCSVCLIIKNDHDYIREWIDYYRLIGVDHFYIADNNSSPPLREILSDYIEHGIITYTYDTRVGPQGYVYNECLRNYGDQNKWIAFFDSDEFLLLKQHDSIRDFLVNYEEFGAVSIPWYLFGSNGHVEKQKSILPSYTTRHPESSCYKTIVQPKAVIHFSVHHVDEFQPGYYAVDPALNRVEGAITQHQVSDVAQLNHYFLRSLRDYEEKIARGPSAGTTNRTMEEFHHVNQWCNVQDTTIIERIAYLQAKK